MEVNGNKSEPQYLDLKTRLIPETTIMVARPSRHNVTCDQHTHTYTICTKNYFIFQSVKYYPQKCMQNMYI